MAVDCSPGSQLFSVATTGVGWAAVIFVLVYCFYTAWRITCCSCRGRKHTAESGVSAARRGACDVPLHAHPFLALLGSFRYARSGSTPSALQVGDAARCACYEQSSGWSATAIRLRLVPPPGSAALPVELDPPADADSWSGALGGRLHPGVFRVTASLGDGTFALASEEARRAGWALQRAAPHAPGGWTAAFSAAMLQRAAARDAPVTARGFAGRPMRRVGAALLIEGLGAFAAATVEVSVASAAWQAHCRPWWARVLTRAVAAAVLLSGVEYCFTAVVPVAVERLPQAVCKRGGIALALPLLGFAVWSLSVNGAAGGGALGSAFVIWLWTLAISHLVLWPALLLLSAGVWRDIPPLPEEHWEAGGNADSAAAPPTTLPPQPAGKRGWGFGRASGGGTELSAVAVAPPLPHPTDDSDDPFAHPAASTWDARPPSGAPRAGAQYGAW